MQNIIQPSIAAIPVEFKILSEDAVLPKLATPESAGYDLYLPLSTPSTIRIYPDEVHAYYLGFAVDLLSPGVAMIMCPRSGTGTRGLHLANSLGVVDSDYQGGVILKLKNTSDLTLYIDARKAVAQALFIPYVHIAPKIVEEFSRTTERGAGGFGSTD